MKRERTLMANMIQQHEFNNKTIESRSKLQPYGRRWVRLIEIFMDMNEK